MKDCFFLRKFPPSACLVNFVARCLHFLSAGSFLLAANCGLSAAC